MAEATKKILLADDTVFFRTMLGSELSAAGFDVTFAGNGMEALTQIDEMGAALNLLVLDLYMPEMDGFGVMEKIQERGLQGKFPVLVITGEYEASDILRRVRELGASGLLSKEAAAEQVVGRVKQMLGL